VCLLAALSREHTKLCAPLTHWDPVLIVGQRRNRLTDHDGQASITDITERLRSMEDPLQFASKGMEHPITRQEREELSRVLLTQGSYTPD
jgi:hypothetical protein